MKKKPTPKLPGTDLTTKSEAVQGGDYANRLLGEFVKLLQAHAGEFKQERSFGRCVALGLGMILAFARHTVTQCVMSLGEGERDWSAWYRLFTGERFKQDRLDDVLFAETVKHVPEDEPYVVVGDGVQTPHTSKWMPGVGLGLSHRSPAFARGLHLCRRWLTGAWLPPIKDGITRAIPIKFLDAFTPKSAPASVPPRNEVSAMAAFLLWVRGGLDGCKRHNQRIVALVDGAFDRKEMWLALPKNTVMMVRTAKNRVLHELPGTYLGRGRPRLYGPKAPTPKEHQNNRAGWKGIHVNVRGRSRRMRVKLCGAYLRSQLPGLPVFLLVIDTYRWNSNSKDNTHRSHESKEAFYLINAVKVNGVWELPYPIDTLAQWAWQRWEVEVTHRDLKAGFGVGQMQCWGKVSSVLATRWCVWLFALMLLSAYRAWGWHVPFALNCAWWRGASRWSFNTVWRYFRIALWQLPSFCPLAPQSPPTDQKFHSRWLSLAHSALAAARA